MQKCRECRQTCEYLTMITVQPMPLPWHTLLLLSSKYLEPHCCNAADAAVLNRTMPLAQTAHSHTPSSS